MRKLVMALAVTGLAASQEVQGQGAPAPRVALQAVHDVSPALGAYTDEVLFGDVWRREGLSPRDRSLVTVSALIANGRAAQLRGHVGRALDNGVRPEEVAEAKPGAVRRA
jgi:4-carboxymuconolactone decarboxylase